ncbi:hypothetical protein [Streptomyces sp. NPDC019507]|uniref:hypothetical protein n=1 Tax=Streptomyces sp. NPDC019507 TaxID=3154689 RepID=UPI0033EB320A
MHNRTMGRLTATAAAAVAGLAVLSPTVSQAAVPGAPAAVQADAAAELPAKLTVAGYKTYLKKNWDKGGRETTARFARLTPAQQKKFVRYLEDRKVYSALKDQVKGNFGRPLHVVDPYNADVTFVTDVTATLAKDKNATATLRFSVSQRIYGIPVTTETLTVKRATKGAVRKTAATASVRNVNAAIAVKAGVVQAATKGAVTKAEVAWTAKPLVKAFGRKAFVKDQSVSAAITKTGKYFTGKLTNR